MNGFNYLEKQYVWTKNAKFQGIIDCTCKECQKFIKKLVKNGQLKEVKNKKF